MSRKKLLERKKHKKKEATKKKLLSRRKKLETQKKHERKQAKFERIFREKIQPIVRPENEEKAAEWAEKKNDEAKKKLEHNLEILQALEDEYVKDMESKKQRNEQLESEGHESLQEKMNALNEKAQQE